MKASETQLVKLLDGTRQFFVPIYQRPYSWTEKQCRQLFEDVVRLAQEDSIPAHFIGSVVHIEDGVQLPSDVSRWLVIDGQQRLTTFSILVEALARASSSNGEETAARKLRNRYLLNADEEGTDQFKLRLSKVDDLTWRALALQKDLPAEFSERVAENFEHFVEWIATSDLDLDGLHSGLKRLVIVDVALDPRHDNPQLIFESLNSTGLDLAQSDLVRNFVLMGLPAAEQIELYEDHWLPIENVLDTAHDDEVFDRFLRAWISVKTQEIPRVDRGYEEFKRVRQRMAHLSVKEVVADLHDSATHFAAVLLDKEEESNFRAQWRRMRGLRTELLLPLLLEIRAAWCSGDLTSTAALEMIRMVEHWVARRMICRAGTTALTRGIPTLWREVDLQNPVESLGIALMARTGGQRFPSDAEFRDALVTRNCYEFRLRNYLLSSLENHGRKEPIEIGNYTIEHVMPQNPELSPEWREMLGADWRIVQEELLHTLGNLTLTGYNSELSDRPFGEKLKMPGGFEDSPLRLNRSIAGRTTWNEEAIRTRSRELAEKALLIWPSPQVDQSALELARNERRGSKKKRLRPDIEHFAPSTVARSVYVGLEAGLRPLGLQSSIWKYWIQFNFEVGMRKDFYSLVFVVLRKGYVRVRFAATPAELGLPENSKVEVTPAGHRLAVMNIKDQKGVEGALDLARRTLELDVSRWGSTEDQ
jgi:hypothetical protein